MREHIRTQLSQQRPYTEVAKLERELLEALNAVGRGPMNLGGKTTALAIHIDLLGTHTTAPRMAIASQCWPVRYSTGKIHADGEVEYITHPDAGSNT